MLEKDKFNLSFSDFIKEQESLERENKMNNIITVHNLDKVGNEVNSKEVSNVLYTNEVYKTSEKMEVDEKGHFFHKVCTENLKCVYTIKSSEVAPEKISKVILTSASLAKNLSVNNQGDFEEKNASQNFVYHFKEKD